MIEGVFSFIVGSIIGISPSGTANSINLDLAGNLEGHLLLVHSEADQNVHPAHSARMARALMAANKRFDYFVVPGAGHAWGQNWTYVQRMIWTYFVRHLMGDDRWDADIFEVFED